MYVIGCAFCWVGLRPSQDSSAGRWSQNQISGQSPFVRTDGGGRSMNDGHVEDSLLETSRSYAIVAISSY
jgi:hypothetical protein